MSPNSRKIASTLAASDHLDSLTGVENRNRFHDHLEQMLQREGGGYVLLTKCNVSRFHHINTSFGYDVGDALLIQVGPGEGPLYRALQLHVMAGGHRSNAAGAHGI